MSDLRALRWLLVAPIAMAMTVAACGDDANDHAHDDAMQLERARQLADASRASRTGAPVTGDGAGDPPTAPAAPAAEPTGVVVPVQALDNTFRPQVVEVHVGDEVVWENRGANDHDVLSIEDGEWGIEVEGFGPGAVYAHVFAEPGEYAYYCSIHGNQQVGMVGTVIVTA